jgi:hypothetical protein
LFENNKENDEFEFFSDMMVLRDEQMYKTPYSKDFMASDKSYVSSTTLAPRGS